MAGTLFGICPAVCSGTHQWEVSRTPVSLPNERQPPEVVVKREGRLAAAIESKSFRSGPSAGRSAPPNRLSADCRADVEACRTPRLPTQACDRQPDSAQPGACSWASGTAGRGRLSARFRRWPSQNGSRRALDPGEVRYDVSGRNHRTSLTAGCLDSRVPAVLSPSCRFHVERGLVRDSPALGWCDRPRFERQGMCQWRA